MKVWQLLLFLSLGLVLYTGCKTHHDVTPKADDTRVRLLYTNALSQKLSPLAKDILRKLHLERTGSIISFSQTSTNTANPKFEYIIIGPPIYMSDGFTYTIKIDHNTRQYWWTKQGGIAGIYEKYGPIQYQENESNKAFEAIAPQGEAQPQR